MSQQLGSPGQGVGGQTGGIGGQTQGAYGPQSGGGGGSAESMIGQPSQFSGMRLDQALTPEMEVALDAAHRALEVCEWCAERCVDHGPEMSECVRLCRDVAELATLHAKFIARDSVFGPEVAETFVVAARECAQECANHADPHCQECAQVLPQAVQATQAMLSSLGASVGGGQQIGGQGVGSQQMGPQGLDGGYGQTF